MERKKRIVISGYYGFDNIGDEAVLYSIIQSLKNKLKNKELEITVLSNQPEKTSKIYGVKAVNRWDIKAVIGVIRKSHLLISGGGSLLQDVTSSKTIPYYLLIVKLAKWNKKKVVFYSQGIGPVNKWYSKYLVKKVVNKVDYIFVRDEESKNTLINIGVTKPPIETAADPVLGMNVQDKTKEKMKKLLQTYQNQDKNPIQTKEKLKVGIYLRPWNNDISTIEKIKEVSYLLHKENLEIFFIPMHQPEDRYLIEKISLPDVPHYKILDILSVEEMFALTGQMDIVISMRLHSLIMATAQAIPVVGLSYDPKVDAFMDLIQNKNCYDVENFSPNQVAKSVLAQLEDITENKKSIQYKTQSLIEKAYKPANQIYKMID